MFPGTFARTTPDKPAAVMAASGERLTYRELEENSARLARYLHGRGLRRGDTLALLSDNQLTAFEVYWAAMRSGLYLTAVNHNLAPDEAAYIVNDSSAKALIVAHSQRDLAEAIAGEIPAVSIRLAFGAPMDGAVDGFGSYADALAATSAEPLPDQPRGSDMLYSSGTTGRPKGVKPLLSMGRPLDQPGGRSLQLIQFPGSHPPPTALYLSPAPLYHAAPLRYCLSFQRMGATIVVMEKFDPEQALELYREIPRHPLAVGADHVHQDAQAARGDPRALRFLGRRWPARSTPPPPARSPRQENE